jgi:hypothetical protein
VGVGEWCRERRNQSSSAWGRQQGGGRGIDTRLLHNGKMRVRVHPNRGAGGRWDNDGGRWWDASRPAGP